MRKTSSSLGRNTPWCGANHLELRFWTFLSVASLYEIEFFVAKERKEKCSRQASFVWSDMGCGLCGEGTMQRK